MDSGKSNPNETPTDGHLWSAIAQGDTNALGLLYDRHAGLVYGIALKVLGSAQEAEDLTQDIFLKLTESSSYDPQRGSLRTFLAVLTRSRAIDRLRSRRRREQQSRRSQGDMRASPPAADNPTDAALQQERSQEVRAALAALSGSQRQVLEMIYYDGLTQAAIAEQLNIPVGTVKSRARRGLLNLRQVIQQSNKL